MCVTYFDTCLKMETHTPTKTEISVEPGESVVCDHKVVRSIGPIRIFGNNNEIHTCNSEILGSHNQIFGSDNLIKGDYNAGHWSNNTFEGFNNLDNSSDPRPFITKPKIISEPIGYQQQQKVNHLQQQFAQHRELQVRQQLIKKRKEEEEQRRLEQEHQKTQLLYFQQMLDERRRKEQEASRQRMDLIQRHHLQQIQQPQSIQLQQLPEVQRQRQQPQSYQPQQIQPQSHQLQQLPELQRQWQQSQSYQPQQIHTVPINPSLEMSYQPQPQQQYGPRMPTIQSYQQQQQQQQLQQIQQGYAGNYFPQTNASSSPSQQLHNNRYNYNNLNIQATRPVAKRVLLVIEDDKEEEILFPAIADRVHDEVALENDHADQVCVICFENKRQCLISPCDHFILCIACSSDKLGFCPLCRRKISSIRRIFK